MSTYGLYKAAGGFRKREREMLARLPELRCALHPAFAAAGLIVNALGRPKPGCTDCVQYADHHGYTVVKPPN